MTNYRYETFRIFASRINLCNYSTEYSSILTLKVDDYHMTQTRAVSSWLNLEQPWTIIIEITLRAPLQHSSTKQLEVAVQARSCRLPGSVFDLFAFRPHDEAPLITPLFTFQTSVELLPGKPSLAISATWAV